MGFGFPGLGKDKNCIFQANPPTDLHDVSCAQDAHTFDTYAYKAEAEVKNPIADFRQVSKLGSKDASLIGLWNGAKVCGCPRTFHWYLFVLWTDKF